MQKPLNTLDGYEIAVARPTAFDGNTANARGDINGTSNPLTLFRVNGDVIVRVFGVCTVDPVGASTIDLGVVGNANKFASQIAATDMKVNKVWANGLGTGAALLSIVLTAVIVNGTDIIETTLEADVTAGNIYYVCMWKPLLPGSTVIGLPLVDGGASVRGY